MKIIMIILGIIAITAIGIYMFLQTDIFGATLTENDLERIRKSVHYKKNKFENLSYTPDMQEGVTYFDIMKEFFKKVSDKEPPKPIPTVKTDLKKLSGDFLQVVWFGHSSYLVRVDGKNILIDPVFSKYASPVPFGAAHFNYTYAYTAADMPPIDILIITHDHYDHLDYEVVKQLQPTVKQVVTSLGVGAHLRKWGYDASRITELDWHESTAIDNLHFTATPARHFSGRSFKRNQTFWSSFVLKTPTHKIFLGGDSGYDTHFKAIGQQYGPFDVAILECGQYNTYWKDIHMMPEQTAQAATELKAKLLLPVHWGKFSLAPHSWNESIKRVTKKAEELNQPIATPMIGSPLIIGSEIKNTNWWNL